jgi:hypothetical protein
MKNLFLFLIIGGALFTCNTGDPYRKSREIYEQTMTIHDEVMPKMGEVLSLKHSLKMKIDSVSDDAIKIQIDSAMSSLDRTYNGMMSWMADLQPVPDKNGRKSEDEYSGADKVPAPDEMINIQQNSLDEIKALKEQMNKSLQNGKDLLQTL